MDYLYCGRISFKQRLLFLWWCVISGTLCVTIVKYILTQSIVWPDLMRFEHPVEVFPKQPLPQDTSTNIKPKTSVHFRPLTTSDDRLNTTSKVRLITPSVALTLTPLPVSHLTPLPVSHLTPLPVLPLIPSSVRSLTSSAVGPVRLICHRFSGRLGNLLFQYASILGISYTTKRIPVFKMTEVLDFRLKTPSSVHGIKEEFQKRCTNAKILPEKSCCFFDEDLLNLNPELDYHISLYLQSWRYFEKHKQQILKDIRFKDAYVTEAEIVVAYLRKRYPGSELIGVHVRKGDFESQKNKHLGYVTATPDYINRALAHFRKRYPQAAFVVASDNLTWCQENIQKDFNVTYLKKRSAEVDLTILSKLDHIVITTGTFSWWAGYMNPGETVYFKDFILPETFVGRQFKPNGEDYIYPEWIPL